MLDEEFLTDPETSAVFVALSHDGVRAAHDAKRVDAYGDGSFDRLSEVIPILLRHKPYAPVLVVITPETVRYYAESIDFLFNQGFRYPICSPDYSAEWSAAVVKEMGRQYKKIADWYYAGTPFQEKKFSFHSEALQRSLPGAFDGGGLGWPNPHKGTLMKITPVKRYKTPQFPIHEALLKHPELLRLVPRRWANSPLVLSALAFACLILASRAEGGTSTHKNGTIL